MMFTIKQTLPVVLMLGMAAGSTAAFAQNQTVNSDAGIQAAPGAGADVVGTNLNTGAHAHDDLAGADLVGPDGEVVGTISVVQPADAGGEELVVIATAGAGGRSVEVPLSELQVETNAQGGVERVSTSYTAADLTAMPQIQM